MDEAARAVLADLAAATDTSRYRIVPGPGVSGERRLLTIGMSTYDDFDGVYFTVTSLFLHHPEVRDRVSVLVVDNNPAGPSAWALKRLERSVPHLRYVPYDRRTGTAARDRVFREANSDWVLCVDSHVQFAPGALAALLDHIAEHPDSDDLVQGPLLHDDMRTLRTHWEPGWKKGMYGRWAADPRGLDPQGPAFEIPMQGLGVFACRTKAWPGLHPAFTGHGGEEGYLHEKFRAAGGRVLCLPALRWTHRFTAGRGVPYPLSWAQRLRNYLIAWDELGLDTEELLEHFETLLGPEEVTRVLTAYEAEQRNPFLSFGGLTLINLDARTDRWQRMQPRLDHLGIPAHLVHRLPATPTPHNHHIGCALSHRRAIAEAHTDGLDSILVLEDDVLFLEGATWVLRRALEELQDRPWSVLNLGPVTRTDRPDGRAGGCHHLEPYDGMTTTHAVVYHRSSYARLLDELPDTVAAMSEWIRHNRAIDQFIARWDQPGCYRTVPAVAAQENMLRLVPENIRDQF